MMEDFMPASTSRLVERQDRARPLPRLHRPKGLVQVLQAAATRDHLVQQQPALAVKLQIARDIDAEAVGAHPRGLDAALCPASSPDVRSAAPTPVSTPQPTSAALSSGISGSIFTSEFSCRSMRSA